MMPTTPPLPAASTAAQPWPHDFPPPLILPPEQPVRFRLGPVSIGVFAICVTLHLVVGLSKWQRTPLLASQDIGVFVFGFLVAIGLAWIAWKLDAQRRAGGLVFCFLMLLFASGRLGENTAANLNAKNRARQARPPQASMAASHRKNPAAIPQSANDVPVSRPEGLPMGPADRVSQKGIDNAREAAAANVQGNDRRVREPWRASWKR